MSRQNPHKSTRFVFGRNMLALILSVVHVADKCVKICSDYAYPHRRWKTVADKAAGLHTIGVCRYST